MKDSDNRYIDVGTGEIAVASGDKILRVMAIGSCVVAIFYDKGKRIAGMAHIMLPGRLLVKGEEHKTKYAEDSIDILVDKMREAGSEPRDIDVSIIGGANILGEGTISDEIINSVESYLEKIELIPRKKRLGGKQRRSVSLELDSGRILYTEGDSGVKELKDKGSS